MMFKAFSVTTCLLVLLFASSAFGQQYSYNYEEMKMEEYTAELAKWQKKLADATASIAECDAAKAAAQTAIDEAMAATDAEWEAIYAALGTDKAGYEAYMAELTALENDVKGFLALSPEEIYSRRAELQGFKDRLAELQKSKISLGPDPYAAIQRIQGLIDQAEQKGQPSAAGRYEVIRGDYLWKIAGRQETFGDPYAWMRIYTANREQIKDPDLIYPRQVFRIVRQAGIGEHVVARGEALTSIAKGYGSAFRWQSIYEANKDLIGTDPNLIYPHTLLKIPGR